MTHAELTNQGYEPLAGPFAAMELDMALKEIKRLKEKNVAYELFSTQEGLEIWTIPKHSFKTSEPEAESEA